MLYVRSISVQILNHRRTHTKADDNLIIVEISRAANLNAVAIQQSLCQSFDAVPPL